MKATITRIKEGKNLREGAMSGTFIDPPELGVRWRLWGEGIKFGTRYLSTSPVTKIKTVEMGWIIDTHTGSQYEIKIKD